MAKYLITYDLRTKGRDYKALIEHLESYSNSVKPLKSVWIVVTDETRKVVADAVRQHIDSNDGLLVVQLDDGASWRRLDIPSDWMREHF